MQTKRDFSLAGMLLLFTVLGFASWAVSLPPLLFDREFYSSEMLVRLLVVWELGIVPIVFLRWRNRRLAAVEMGTTTSSAAAALLEPSKKVSHLSGKSFPSLISSRTSAYVFGVLTLVASMLGLAAAWQRNRSIPHAPPEADVSIGSPLVTIAPPGNAHAGHRSIEFSGQYSNNGPSDLWVYGHSTAHPFFKLFTRPSGATEWHDHGPLFCGTGAQKYQVPPGHRDSFRVFVSGTYSGQEMRIALPVFAQDNDAEYSYVYTEAVEIP